MYLDCLENIFSSWLCTDVMFGMLWETDMTHEQLNEAWFADEPYSRLMQRMKDIGVLDNAVLFFLSDHGLRYGAYAQTDVGAIETNLPLFHVAFPPWYGFVEEMEMGNSEMEWLNV